MDVRRTNYQAEDTMIIDEDRCICAKESEQRQTLDVNGTNVQVLITPSHHHSSATNTSGARINGYSHTPLPDTDEEDEGLSSDDHESLDEPDDYCGGNPGDVLINTALGHDITTRLAAAGWHCSEHGPVGMAAAAAIASSKSLKRKHTHTFETNPSTRKRHQNRLIRKLRATIDEFTSRVGQQAVVLIAAPGKETSNFKCFGAKPLEDVMKNLKMMIVDELETALNENAPPPPQEDPMLFDLPPLVIDGIPTPVEKMTQAQLRAFIPLMLKYSTGRGKPGWGRESTKPPWWPVGQPWANVRMDARSEEQKQRTSWTIALRQIVVNCYKYHGREDLLPVFLGDEECFTSPPSSPKMKITRRDGSILRYTPKAIMPNDVLDNNSRIQPTSQYTPAVVQTNMDGTISFIVGPNNQIITLPDGTQVQNVTTVNHNGTSQTIHTMHSMDVNSASSQQNNCNNSGNNGGNNGASNCSNGNSVITTTVNYNSVTEATLSSEGQLILTSNTCQGYPVSVSDMLTTVQYPAVVNIHHNNDGTLSMTPVVQCPKMNSNQSQMNGGIMQTAQVITMNGGSGGQQMLQVIVKDGNSMASGGVKVE